MTQELQDFLFGKNNHSKKECLDKINEEMSENIKLFNKGDLTFEEFHWVQGELVKLKNELGL